MLVGTYVCEAHGKVEPFALSKQRSAMLFMFALFATPVLAQRTQASFKFDGVLLFILQETEYREAEEREHDDQPCELSKKDR